MSADRDPAKRIPAQFDRDAWADDPMMDDFTVRGTVGWVAVIAIILIISALAGGGA